MRRLSLFVDGARVDATSGRAFPDVNPATGAVACEVDEASADDVDRAVSAAKRALQGPWGKTSAADRAAVLDRVADLMDKRREEFLRAEIEDTGKPIGLASTIDIPRGAANFRIFAAMLRALGNDSYEQTLDDGSHALHLVVRERLGVVGVICPWNLPLLLMTWKVAPALAAGNCVVVKPSEETPQTATLLGDVMNEAGVPKGVYNVVHGFGPGSAGEALVAHPDVAAITFTGETRTGSAIMAAAAPRTKRLSFELGGKNAAIIFADCDLDKAVAGTLRSTFLNTGQVCLCSERILVERPIYDRFVERMRQGADAFRAGDPMSSTTTLGPLISQQHREKVLSYYMTAAAENARFVLGGSTPKLDAPWSNGFYVEPTLWTDLDDSARVAREEIFGPCAVISPFDSEEEAVARANNTEYGLCAALWTQNLARAHRVSRLVEAGLVWVNCWYVRDLRVPFGGMKRSGIGREGGRASFDFYAEPKSICIKL
ncbi:MAG TPA: 2-hydroxymuconic semialdehyde dehydrogenase [Myxococcota bacterium]|jgi:aminomuconate-semialdehyde/2-hydroxymuconate-6-semialdehyde dehydrogenase